MDLDPLAGWIDDPVLGTPYRANIRIFRPRSTAAVDGERTSTAMFGAGRVTAYNCTMWRRSTQARLHHVVLVEHDVEQRDQRHPSDRRR